MNYERTNQEKLFIIICLIIMFVGIYFGTKQPQVESSNIYPRDTIPNTNTITGSEEPKTSTWWTERPVVTVTTNPIRDTKQTSWTIKPTDSIWVKSIQMMSNQPIIDSMLNAWVHKDMIESIIKVARETKIHPYYFAIIGLSENIWNPWAIWDNWCSFWAYQFNSCVIWRKAQIWYDKKFIDCAKDYECSTRMVAEKIRSAYKCNVDENWYIEKFYECLPIHNGTKYPSRYKNKILKNNQILFSNGW